MNKYTTLKLMELHGDSTVSLRGQEAIVATIDFSTPYIKNKKHRKIPFKKDSVTVFSWTDDSFRDISVKDIKNIKPLSEVLGNKKDGEETESW